MKVTLMLGLLGAAAYEICKVTGALNAYVPRDSILWSNRGLAATVGAFLVLGILLASIMPKKKKA